MSETSYQEQALQRIAERAFTVCVIGMGYVGLPLAMVFTRAGFRVVGVDVDAGKVASLLRGESHVEDVPAEAVRAALDADLFDVTTDYARVAEADSVHICVPTPLRKTRDPDMSYIAASSEAVAEHLRPGHLLVLESTTYPGTTRELLLPLVERTGLTVGEDVFLAFSPERVDPGRTDWTTETTPKVVGGVTPACSALATALYGAAVETVVPVSSPDAAEMTKIFENTFRAVNIGLANELLLMCDALGIDVWEVVDAASTKPFGFMRFTPGPGLGGHCIPVDPHYLSWRLKELNYTARFIELASEINTQMPVYWADRVQDRLNEAGKPLNGSRVLVLGVAYKPGIGDLRESPALDIMGLLRRKGADVAYHDPHVPTLDWGALSLKSVGDLDAELAAADCTLLVTDHAIYDANALARQTPLFVNTRGGPPASS